MIRENVYGSRKRLDWIRTHAAKHKPVIEFGCGTGAMISLPLLAGGYDVVGVDLDRRSVSYGRNVFVRHGFDPERLRAIDIAALEGGVGTIIASEVLEHIPAPDAPSVLATLRSKLDHDGVLLVTVPNGYGWFELESWLWYKLGLGRIVQELRLVLIKLGLMERFRVAKQKVLGKDDDNPYVNTLADDVSPHVRRYTFSSIRKELRENGFEVDDITGSVLFAGPVTNLLFKGSASFMRMNGALGAALPRIASGFFVLCRPSDSVVDRDAAHRAGGQSAGRVAEPFKIP